MSARYTVQGPWRRISSTSITVGFDEKVIGYIERADLLDTRTGDTYEDGARRVRSLVEGFRSKTFKGETAWSDARRYSDDLHAFARRRIIETGSLLVRKAS
jgi:hypothetical protein